MAPTVVVETRLTPLVPPSKFWVDGSRRDQVAMIDQQGNIPT